MSGGPGELAAALGAVGRGLSRPAGPHLTSGVTAGPPEPATQGIGHASTE